MFLVRSLQEMPKSFVLFPSSTFTIFVTHSLCLWSRMGSRVKISHYIQPSNFSSALLFVCVGPTQCCLNVTILQRISSFWMVFCYQNCSDLLWEKIVQVIEKKFQNSRLKAEIWQNFWDHQWKVRTIFGINIMLF